MAARNQPGSRLSGTISWAPGRTHLRDATGPFATHRVPTPTSGAAFDPAARARAILATSEGRTIAASMVIWPTIAGTTS